MGGGHAEDRGVYGRSDTGLGRPAAGSVAESSAAPKPAAPWTVPSDAEIRRILVDRVDIEHRGVGIVVGVIDAYTAAS